MEKTTKEKEAVRRSAEKAKQGELFAWRQLDEDNRDLKNTRIQHFTKGMRFTIKL